MTELIKSINWIITNRCNSRCQHCDFWRNKRYRELNIEELEKILNVPTIKDSYEEYKKAFDISLGGGEPFLREDLQEIVDLIESYYPSALKTISTNGLLTKKILKFLKNNYKLNFKLNISIDGIGKIHDKIRGFEGAFKKTTNTIKNIKKYFPNQEIELKFTLIPKNHKQITKVYKLASELGCDFSFKPAENMKNYTNKNGNIPLNFTKDQICHIRNQTFKLADLMFRKGDYKKSKFFKDIPFYLANKKKPLNCSVMKDHLTIMPTGDYIFCIKDSFKGNLLNGYTPPNPEENKTCSSCMLMCGPYKDYLNAYPNLRTANIETTYKCNLDCDMCTQKELRKKENIKDMSLATFRKVIEENKDINHISFVGGEPFLNQDFFQMMNSLDKEGKTYEITTNGTLLNDNTIEELKDCIGLKQINYSLDGLREFHDEIRGKETFDRCINSLKKTKNEFNTTVCCVIRRDNNEEIPPLIEKLAKEGIKEYKIIYGMDHSIEKIKKSKNFSYSLNLQGPKFGKQISDSRVISALLKRLDAISEKNNIYISYEPPLLKENPYKFLNESKEDTHYCKQIQQYRFNPSGERIICEFVRNKYENKDEIFLNHHLPICERCCKLKSSNKELKWKTK